MLYGSYQQPTVWEVSVAAANRLRRIPLHAAQVRCGHIHHKFYQCRQMRLLELQCGTTGPEVQELDAEHLIFQPVGIW